MKKFKEQLMKGNLSDRTITFYVYAVKKFFQTYKNLSKQNLLSFKNFLLERYKPRTTNLYLQALNKYLIYNKKPLLKLKLLKFQEKNYLENVISNSDYMLLKEKLKADKNYMGYFIVWVLGATGVRISELISLKVEHIKLGFYDIYSKGGKIRRIFLSKNLCQEILNWLKNNNQTSGYLFLNKYGNKITSRGVSYKLKNYARKYGINLKVVYPHSFRHRFAKNFLEKYDDLSLLADLMGHTSIETTRIYLRKTTSEQQNIINKIINW